MGISEGKKKILVNAAHRNTIDFGLYRIFEQWLRLGAFYLYSFLRSQYEEIIVDRYIDRGFSRSGDV